LLGHTRERLRQVFNDDCLLFVVTKDHERFYERELADVEESRLLEQPANRGTGVAVIAALLQLPQNNPDAIIGIFPSDHYYADDCAFATTVKSAISISEEHHESIIVIGTKPQWPEIEYGWIEPGASIANRCRAPVFGVNRFCEKPSLREARDLMSEGGLWNTFVMIGRAGAFLNLVSATVLPTMTHIGHAIEQGDLSDAYSDIEAIDFSRDVLSQQPRRLLVMQDSATGWADLGHPGRVIDTLDRHQIQPEWLCEIRRTNPPPLNTPVARHQSTPAFPDLVTAQ
jgi:mannose-1-phosphate guanylyltransferase